MREEPAEVVTSEGCPGWEARVYNDPDPDNPREEYDHVGTIVYSHRQYDFGEDISGQEFNIPCEKCGGSGEVEVPKGVPDLIYECPECGGYGGVEVDPVRWLKVTRDAVVVLPIGLLDHSGLHIWVQSEIGEEHWTDPGGWDSGTVGFIYATRKQVEKEWGGDLTQAEKYLRGEVEEFDQYLRGDVWGIVVVERLDDGEEVEHESCWGFYGWEYAQQEALSMLEGAWKWEQEQVRKVGEVMAMTRIQKMKKCEICVAMLEAGFRRGIVWVYHCGYLGMENFSKEERYKIEEIYEQVDGRREG